MAKDESAAGDIDKAIAAARKAEKEATVNTARLKREALKLEASNKLLSEKNAELLAQSLQGEDGNKKIGERNQNLRQESAELTGSVLDQTKTLQGLESQIQAATELLESKKSKLDSDLAEYAVVKKEEIRKEILVEAAKLTAITTEAAALQQQIDTKVAELKEISAVYDQELQDSRQSTAEKNRIIAENDEAIATSQRELAEVRESLQKIYYERDRAIQSTENARTEHQNFLDYEKRARKALNAKDEALQAQSAEISEANQFLQNRRSFLPEL